ncbi:MAG: hypothetical protein VKI63_06090 [Cyanobium sp.]|nr:hypothetical protein [Cyanobium sp.]
MWIDNDFPKLLGAELYRPHPAYIVEMACEPVVVWDFGKNPGQTVQLDRYRFWGNPGTKDSRERTADQTLGTASSRNLIKDKVLVTLKEYTGPADPADPSAPSTFKVARETLLTAQRLLLDYNNVQMFNQSIGSMTLMDDYRRWRDRVFSDEFFKAEAAGAADSTQGGYYFPLKKIKAGSNPIVTYAAGESAKFDVKTDLLEVVKDLRKRNVPTFQDGYYRAICDPVATMHLRQNDAFREISRYPGSGMIDPMQPHLAPNASFYTGFGPAYGQAGFVAGQPVMPTGFLFESVRWFESTNLAEKSYQVTIADASITNAVTTAAPILFFGPQAVGVGIGGKNAQILLSNDDDFGRFIIMVWSIFGGFELLNRDFVTVAYSFVY